MGASPLVIEAVRTPKGCGLDVVADGVEALRIRLVAAGCNEGRYHAEPVARVAAKTKHKVRWRGHDGRLIKAIIRHGTDAWEWWLRPVPPLMVAEVAKMLTGTEEATDQAPAKATQDHPALALVLGRVEELRGAAARHEALEHAVEDAQLHCRELEAELTKAIATAEAAAAALLQDEEGRKAVRALGALLEMLDPSAAWNQETWAELQKLAAVAAYQPKVPAREKTSDE